MGLSHNRIVEQISRIVRSMTYDMRKESVRLLVERGRAWELVQAHETLYRILRERDVDGVYRELRGTYFVPDSARGVRALSD